LELIFSQPWWLDAAAPGRWEEVTVDNGDALSGRLVYVPERHWLGTMSLGSPPMTPRLGPLLQGSSGQKLSRLISDQVSVMTELIEKLPNHHYFAQNCSPSFTYWLPFYWAGFEQTTQYSYVLDDLNDEDALWQGLSQSHRRKIRKGDDRYRVRHDLDPQVLIDILITTYERRGRGLPVDPTVVKRVYQTALDHDAARLVAAVDGNGRALAVALIVWDRNRAYYLAGGRADHDGPDAMPLVLWDSIRLAAKVSQSFDFEGSMIKGIEQFFRGFGGRPEPYSFLSRATPGLRLARMVQETGRVSWDTLAPGERGRQGLAQLKLAQSKLTQSRK